MIKKILATAFLFFSLAFFAQAPQGINYQGVARNSSGQALGLTPISLEFKIWQGNPNGGGTMLYSEFQTGISTDTFGLYSLVIGSKTGSGTGSFNTIPWAGGNMWIEVYIDPANGTNYALVSQQQLMSVPYALYAETSGSGGSGSVSGTANNIPKINPTGNGIKKSIMFESTDSSSIGIGTAAPNANAVLEIANTGAPGAAGKGLFIPRMTYNERNLIPTSALTHGLIVFQTNSQNTVFPQGFWYYDAISANWLLLAPAQAVWTLSGNPVTTPGTHFLGTMDDKDLVFKTGNAVFSQFERMRILSNSNGGNVQFGDPSSNSQYIFPAAKGAPGDVLQMDPANTNKLIWTPFPDGTTGYWTRSGGKLYPSSLSDSVGIGTSSPMASLDVYAPYGTALNAVSNFTASPGVTISTNNPANGYAALDVSSTGTLGNAINATAGNAYALSGISNDATALWVQNNSSGSATLDAFNNGTHPVGFFHNAGLNGSGPVIYAITADPAGYSAKFVGGQGIQTDGFEFNTGANPGYLLQSDAVGRASWVSPGSVLGPPTWTVNGTNIFPVNTGMFVGVGTNSPSTLFNVVGSGSSAISMFQNTGSGDAVNGITAGGGAGVVGGNNGNGPGISGFSNATGTGNAGYFTSSNPNNTANALDVSHQGKGIVASFYNTVSTNSSAVVNVNNVGQGSSIAASATGTGSVANFSINNTSNASSAMNISTNGTGFAINAVNTGTVSSAGMFQNNNSASTGPALQVINQSAAPALKVGGNGSAGAIAALFNAGSVGIATGTVNPTSGLDVKTSVGISVHKYTATGTFNITLADQSVTHICSASGNFTFNLPDATLCPGRILIFTSDQVPTGGNFTLQGCCSQTINGNGNMNVNLVTGTSKASYGLISDGSNWQIIFKN